LKYSFLFLCIILWSCEDSGLNGGCIPIGGELRFSFNSQEGTDSQITYDSWWSFTGVRGEEGCEVKPNTMECSWFSVVKKDSIVFASVKQNNTGQKRYEYIEIKGNGGHSKCSDMWGEITIIQCPELTDMELSKEELLFGSEGGIDSVIVTTNRNSWLNDPYISVNYENASYIFSNFWSDTNFWININMTDERKIIFSVSKNESGKERNAILILDYYNCGASLKVIQSAW